LIGELLVTFMVSQGVEASFGYLTAVSLAIGFGGSYYFGIYKKQYVEGYIIGRAFYEFFNLMFIVIMFFIKVKGKKFSLKEFKNALRGICGWFKDVLTYTVALYSEFFGYEISTLICTLTDDDVQIAAYTSAINLAYIVWAIGNGFSNTARTRVNYLLGQSKGESAKTFFYFSTTGMVLLGLSIGGVLFLTNGYVANIYANTNVAINAQLVKLIKLYSFLTLGDFFFAYMFTIARSTNQICLNMCLDYLILVFGQFALSYYLVDKKGGNCLTCLAVMEGLLIFIYIILVARFCMMDWTAIAYEEEIPMLEADRKKEPGAAGSRIVDGELLAKLKSNA
jgi:Na+-driven multidrug efflux pump